MRPEFNLVCDDVFAEVDLMQYGLWRAQRGVQLLAAKGYKEQCTGIRLVERL